MSGHLTLSPAKAQKDEGPSALLLLAQFVEQLEDISAIDMMLPE